MKCLKLTAETHGTTGKKLTIESCQDLYLYSENGSTLIQSEFDAIAHNGLSQDVLFPSIDITTLYFN